MSDTPMGRRDLAVTGLSEYRGEVLYSNSWALVMGIDRYADARIPVLNFAESDAREVAAQLREVGFPAENIRLLTGAKVCRETLIRTLEEDFNSQMQPDDRLVVYFAGHGASVSIHQELRGYLLLQDSKVWGEWPVPERPHLTKIPAPALEMKMLLQLLGGLSAKHKLLVVDSCFSGFTAQSRGLGEVRTDDPRITQWTREPVTQILTAGRSGQVAMERDGHGVFTAQFLKGLRGNATPRGDNLITFHELVAYVRDRVVREGGDQDPQACSIGEGEFLFIQEHLAHRQEAARLRRGAEQALNEGRLEDALQELAGALDLDPNSPALVQRMEAAKQLIAGALAKARPTPVAPPPAPPAPQKRTASWNERELARHGLKWSVDSLTVSPDNRHLAFWEGKGGFIGFGSKLVLNRDGVQGSDLEEFVLDRLTFSPDSTRLASAARRRGKWCVAADGRRHREYDDLMATGPLFSPDSRRLAYGAQRNGKWLVVLDEQESPEYDTISAGLVFSPDSRRLAYGAKSNGQWVVVADGQQGPRYDSLGNTKVAFSPDSRRIAYIVKMGGKWLAVIDGQQSPVYDAIDAGGVVFGEDGRRFAYGAERNGKWSVFVNEQPGASFDEILGGSVIFSPDGRRLAYGAKRNSKWLAVVDEEQGLEFDGMASTGFVFSPDSRRVAYLANRNDKWVVVADRDASAEYDGISAVGPVFSADGRHLAFGVRRQSKWIVVLDGKEGKEYTALPKTPLVFSPNGEHFAYVASPGSGWVLVCDEKEYALKGTIVKGGRIVFDGNDSLHLITVSSDNEFPLMTLSF